MYLREGKLGILNIWRNIWKHSKVFTFKYPRKSDNHKYLTFLAKIGTPGSGKFRNLTKQKWPKMDQKGCLPTMGVVGDILPFPYRGEWRRLREQIQSTSGSQTITKLSWSSGWPWPIGWCLSAMIIMLWYWWLETFLLGDPSWLPDFVFCVLFTPTNTTNTTVREQDLDWHILGVGWFSGGDLGSEQINVWFVVFYVAI